MASLETRMRVPTLDVHGAFIRRTDWSDANLLRANLSQADCSNASFRNANFQHARLFGTILRGADLTGARNLTIEQLATAVIDERTRLPDYIDREKLLTETNVSRQPESAHS